MGEWKRWGRKREDSGRKIFCLRKGDSRRWGGGGGISSSTPRDGGAMFGKGFVNFVVQNHFKSVNGGMGFEE